MYGGPVSMSGPDPAAERPRNPRPTPKAQPDREGDLPTPDCCRKAALPAPTCKVQNEGAAPHTGGGAFFHVRWFHLRIRASRRKAPRRGSHQRPGPADKRTRAAAHIKGPAELPFPHPPSESGRNPGYPRSHPAKTADKSRTASGHGPLPRHSIQSGQKTGGSGKGRKQRRRRDGGEGGEGGREGEKGEGSQKAGKQKSWEAGSRKAGKPESGEAGKRGSREAGKPGSGRRHKKA